MIPLLEDGRGPADQEQEIIKFPAKAYKNCEDKYSADVNMAASTTESGKKKI